VILGLLCPFYIAKLEFKSKEELQLMPQTEEEHLTGLEEENESIEGQPTDSHHNTDPDAEVSLWTDCVENKDGSQEGSL
jgi:transient receptor potential cation channel subfamily M protein 3